MGVTCSSKVPPSNRLRPSCRPQTDTVGSSQDSLRCKQQNITTLLDTDFDFPDLLSSILRTYKVSRKLQNIYYYQEGIIKSWSKDKQDYMQNTETPQSCFTSPVLQQFLTVMNTKTYHTSVPRRAKIQFCTKHLFVFFPPSFFTKTTLDM